MEPTKKHLRAIEQIVVAVIPELEESTELATQPKLADPDLVGSVLPIVDQLLFGQVDDARRGSDDSQPLIVHPGRRKRCRSVHKLTPHHDRCPGDEISPQESGEGVATMNRVPLSLTDLKRLEE